MPEYNFTVPDDPAPDPPVEVNPLYERQASLGLTEPGVMVIGAGGVGCWVALALTLGGASKLVVYDGDTISLNNLNRFPLPEVMVGELKSVALCRWLETLRPKADITARGAFDPAYHTNHAEDVNWLVCCTDSLKSRVMCHKYAVEHSLRYLEVGADGERWTLSPNPPEFSTNLEAEAGYRSVPVHIGPCMMAGAAASYYILHNCNPIVSHAANWVKGPIIMRGKDLGSLKFDTIKEVTFEDKEMLTCPECPIEIEQDTITIIHHLREHHPNWGLAEAKAHAENLLEQIRAVEPDTDTDDELVEEIAESEALDGQEE